MLTHMKQVHRVSAPKVYATNNNGGSRFEYNNLWYFNVLVQVYMLYLSFLNIDYWTSIESMNGR